MPQQWGEAPKTQEVNLAVDERSDPWKKAHVTLLEQIDWRRANAATRNELHNREVHFPPVSMYRWWARRSSTLIGALLDSGRTTRRVTISDPFSGGGTVALEAVRRGFYVHAQDINPWATWGLETAVDGVDPGLLKEGIDRFWSELGSLGSGEYAAKCPTHGESLTLAAFWAREATCRSCHASIFLYPYTLITLASRKNDETMGYFGCPACGGVTHGRVGNVRRCEVCKHSLADARTPLFPDRIVVCRHCSRQVMGVWQDRPRWRLVLVQRSCGATSDVHFDLPTASEIHSSRHARLPRALSARILRGMELNVLRRAGFRRWADLYPPRQLRALLQALDVARSLDVEQIVRNRLLLAIAGAGEMAGRVCRWDRFHPKGFEALANHRYSVVGLAVEQNPLAPRGRGNIVRRLQASLRAAQWLHGAFTEQKAKRYRDPAGRPSARATVTLGSSANQPLPDNSIDLVVTDPPYYDAVQYGELSALFLAWLEVATGRSISGRTLDGEAVPNSLRNDGAVHYEKMLVSIFRETARTLAVHGTVILSYHSTDFRGWAALGTALQEARLQIVALGVGRSENCSDHAKRGRRAFGTDLIIECRHQRSGAHRPTITTKARTSEHKELLAAGEAIATKNANGEAMARQFLMSTKRMRNRLIVVPESLRGPSDVI